MAEFYSIMLLCVCRKKFLRIPVIYAPDDKQVLIEKYRSSLHGEFIYVAQG